MAFAEPEGENAFPLFHDRRQREPEPQPERKPRAKPFRATHIYDPQGMDAWDPKVHPGSEAIPPGSPVKRTAQVGQGKMAFHWIEDRNGNQMSVWKSSLKPRQGKPKRGPQDA